MNLWAATDKGMVRTNNQDSYLLDRLQKANQALMVVCDGMGGARAGNIASRLAVEAFSKSVRGSVKGLMSREYVKNMVVKASISANSEVYNKSRIQPECTGMGTTLVAAFINGDTATIANVGDSRCYHICEDGIKQITKDHSLVAHLVEAGKLTETEALNHPNKNLITRALGAEQNVDADVFQLQLKRGDCILLCTDGLTNCISEQEILYEVLYSDGKEGACEKLVQMANERGGLDNITVALAEV